MSKIVIEVEGVAVEAVLNEQKCPKLCEVFLGKLPYSSPLIQEMYSGRALATLDPLPIPDEVWNQFTYPRPGIEDRSFKTNMNLGDVVLYPGAETNKVCISYGLAQFREGPAGPSYVNHLATIDRSDPNFAAFMQKCADVYTKGSKVITFRGKE